MQTYKRLKTLGCLASASEKLSPPSTRVQTSLMTSFITLLVVCSARACSDCTMAKTGVHHRGQLAGENDEIRQRHLATGRFAAAGHFFLNG